MEKKVYESVLEVLAANYAAQLDDEQIAREMRRRHPNKKSYQARDVIGWRSLFNRGLLPGQYGKPETRLQKHKSLKRKPIKLKVRKHDK